MTCLDNKFDFVLIGADLNCYNIARAVHEAFGKLSYAFGRQELGCTKYSKIVKFTAVPKLDDPDTFISALRGFRKQVGDDRQLVLFACTDDYAGLAIRFRDELEAENFIIPYAKKCDFDRFQGKADFYKVCEAYGVPYPKTQVFSKGFDPSLLAPEALGFDYPIIVKPSSSILYWKHPFDGMKKVYSAKDPAQAEKILNEIFASGYPDTVVAQDMIPGGDDRMHVLTTYSGADGRVRMACLGHVLLEEHTPKGRGNHAAIVTCNNPKLVERFTSLLDSIGYTGFANFDIKFDERDGSYRVFEINMRQGRSNYYVTAAGMNLAKLVADDRVFGVKSETAKLVTNEIFWHIVPKGIVYRYTRGTETEVLVKKLVSEHREASSYFYPYDTRRDIRRLYYALGYTFNHYKKYRQYKN